MFVTNLLGSKVVVVSGDHKGEEGRIAYMEKNGIYQTHVRLLNRGRLIALTNLQISEKNNA